MRITLLLLLFSTITYATKIQILHINDLHSYLKGPSPSLGGYYRVKTAIDTLKANAIKDGMETLVLDAGDFGEGSYLFLYDNGISSLKAFGMLGVDATVIGNHDYMFGGPSLSKQIQESGLKTKLLGANIAHTDDMRLKGILKADSVFNIGGKSIYVYGLTTPAPHFQYYLRPGVIFPEIPVSRAYTKIAREDQHDAVIALTHIGLNSDKKLVRNDPNIDLVVGGHSHTRLEEPVFEKNSDGRVIPIVQTGAHGMALGKLILEIPEDGRRPYVIDYELVDLNQYIARDKKVLDAVNKISSDANREIGHGRFYDIIGKSNINLGGYSRGKHDFGDGCWLNHVGKIVQSESNSDVGLYLSIFMGDKVEAGDITYGDIIKNFPHINEFGNPGWEIMKIKMSGWQILSLMTGMINLGAYKDQIIVGGIDYNYFTVPDFIPYFGGRSFFSRFRINGKRLKFKKKYEVALPYELKRMLEGLLSKKLAGYLNLNAVRDEYYLWPMAERYISNISEVDCL